MGTSDYRAIEVIPGQNCTCPLSKLAGKRMLYADIEALLSHSDFYPHCTCTFKHYSDRRQGLDRRNFQTIHLNTAGVVRSMPYGRRALDVHNRARDRSHNEATGENPSTLQLVG